MVNLAALLLGVAGAKSRSSWQTSSKNAACGASAAGEDRMAMCHECSDRSCNLKQKSSHVQLMFWPQFHIQVIFWPQFHDYLATVPLKIKDSQQINQWPLTQCFLEQETNSGLLWPYNKLLLGGHWHLGHTHLLLPALRFASQQGLALDYSLPLPGRVQVVKEKEGELTVLLRKENLRFKVAVASKAKHI